MKLLKLSGAFIACWIKVVEAQEVFKCNPAGSSTCTGLEGDPCPVKLSANVPGYQVDDVLVMTYDFAFQYNHQCDGAMANKECEAYTEIVFLKVEAGDPAAGVDFETGPAAAKVVCPEACVDPAAEFSGLCQDPPPPRDAENGQCHYGYDNSKICDVALTGATITHEMYEALPTLPDESTLPEESTLPPVVTEGPQCSSFNPTIEIQDSPNCGAHPKTNLCHVAVAGFEVGDEVTIAYIQNSPDDDSMCTANYLGNKNCRDYGGAIYAQVVSASPVEGVAVELSANGIMGLCQSPCMASGVFTGVCQLLPPKTETCVEPGTGGVCDVALLGEVVVTISGVGEDSTETEPPGDPTPGESTAATTSNAFMVAVSASFILLVV